MRVDEVFGGGPGGGKSGGVVDHLRVTAVRVDRDGSSSSVRSSSSSLSFLPWRFRRRAAKTIRELALSLPESYEDAPWGFPVFKVADNRMFALADRERSRRADGQALRGGARDRVPAPLGSPREPPRPLRLDHRDDRGCRRARDRARMAARVVLPEGAREAARRGFRRVISGGPRRRGPPPRRALLPREVDELREAVAEVRVGRSRACPSTSTFACPSLP